MGGSPAAISETRPGRGGEGKGGKGKKVRAESPLLRRMHIRSQSLPGCALSVRFGSCMMCLPLFSFESVQGKGARRGGAGAGTLLRRFGAEAVRWALDSPKSAAVVAIAVYAVVIVSSGGVGGGSGRPEFGPQLEPSLWRSACRVAGVLGALLGYLWRVLVVIATGVGKIVEAVSSV